MRYYYYGNQEKSTRSNRVWSKAAEESSGGSDAAAVSMTAQEQRIEGDLVIEEDTIYEIDRDCLRCKARIS